MVHKALSQKAIFFSLFVFMFISWTGLAETPFYHNAITDQEYLELAKWVFRYPKPVSQKWGYKNCSLYGSVNQCTNPSLTCLHTGVDYPGQEGATQVFSATSGVVINVVEGCKQRQMDCLSWVAVYNRDVSVTFLYLHLEAIFVRPNDQLRPGDPIGTVGARGYATGPHLHFEARPGKRTHAALCISGTTNPYDAAKSARASAPVGALSITGLVTAKGKALPNVSLNLTGPLSSLTSTDARGYYVFSGLPIGDYTVTPTKAGYSFSPASRRVILSNKNAISQNFNGVTIAESYTATVLVMDVSGSMGWRWKGGIKIESAKQAALQFIEQVANEPRPPGAVHEIAVVTFSGDANLALQLTSSYAQAKRVVIELEPIASTNVGAGLTTALRELEKVSRAQRFIILLSDGKSNTGLTKPQILSGPVVEARQKRICIHTVAFGNPGDIDDEFLRKIASGSGCGSYNYAATGFKLFGTYVKIRHVMLGSNRIVEFTSETSKGSRIYVLPGQSVALGAFQLTGPAQEIHYTLAWSEPGRMRAKLVDPSGRQVNYTYPRAKIYSGSGFSHVTVFSPKQGIWRVAAVVGTTFPRGIEYYGVTSARTGGIVIPYRVPKICIYDDICIPLPDLPTALIVIISVGALAVFLYQQLVVK